MINKLMLAVKLGAAVRLLKEVSEEWEDDSNDLDLFYPSGYPSFDEILKDMINWSESYRELKENRLLDKIEVVKQGNTKIEVNTICTVEDCEDSAGNISLCERHWKMANAMCELVRIEQERIDNTTR